MSPLISVVMPAYNAEKSVSRALRSLLAQNYENLEIVLVDDASSDDTAVMARRALESSARGWRIITHEKNMGTSCSRNTGLRAALGEYTLFMDSDDMADSDFISTLHDAISASGCDIAFCGYRSRDTETGEEIFYPPRLNPRKKYSSEDLAVMRILNKVKPSICTMLFRRDFLLSKGIEFTEGCFAGEDVEFAVTALSLCEEVVFSAKCPYVYLIHEGMGSIANAATKEQRLNRYIDNTKAHFRLADCLLKNSRSGKIRDIARYMLLPLSHARMLKICARRGDREQFDLMRKDPEVRSILLSSFRSFFWKPEVFLKSLCLLLMPEIYFKLKSDAKKPD